MTSAITTTTTAVLLLPLFLFTMPCTAFLTPTAVTYRRSIGIGSRPRRVTNFNNRKEIRGIIRTNRIMRYKYGSLKQRNNDDGDDEFYGNGSKKMTFSKEWREKATNLALLEKLFSSSLGGNEGMGSSLVELELFGRGSLIETKTSCIFLSPPSSSSPSPQSSPRQCLTIPLSPNPNTSKSQLKLLSFACSSTPISKSLCLTLNPLLINRDGSLYDNLPWSTWTIDPLEKNRDAAGNVLEKRFHLGKRDAYDRFMGKDWKGRSLSLGNIAARVKYMLEPDDNDDEDGDDDNVEGEDTKSMFDEEAISILARRVLEVELREARMGLAEAEEQLAIFRADRLIKYDGDDGDGLNDETILRWTEDVEKERDASSLVERAQTAVEECKSALEELNSMENGDSANTTTTGSSAKNNSFVSDLLLAIVSGLKSNGDAPPYRGAMGYEPVVDTKEEMFVSSILPYSSPFELMKEIIETQLNAEVIGCVMEDTSLFGGSVIYGGALVLKRKGRKKVFSIEGEEVEMEDMDDDYGSGGGLEGGKVEIVECDCDEAIGMALACDVGMYVDKSLWEKTWMSASLMVEDDREEEEEEGKKGLMDVIPYVKIEDESITMAVQGNGEPSVGTSIQIPRDENAMPNFFGPSSKNQPVFNTDNPIQSLDEYDRLTIEDKAQLLLSLDSFKGRLPRPRTLRESEWKQEDGTDIGETKEKVIGPLDEMLLPLIDESVRRQMLIRDATRLGDDKKATMLRDQKSMRQIAKERSKEARDAGQDGLADMWEEEAEFYATLRADVTQDEGAYSSFLDRDAWYERDRQAAAKRVDKKKFGTLLDGIE